MAAAVFSEIAVCVEPVSSRNRNGPRPFSSTCRTMPPCGPGSNGVTPSRSSARACGYESDTANDTSSTNTARMWSSCEQESACAPRMADVVMDC